MNTVNPIFNDSDYTGKWKFITKPSNRKLTMPEENEQHHNPYWPYAIVDGQGIPCVHPPIRGIPITKDAKKLGSQIFKMRRLHGRAGSKTNVMHGGKGGKVK